MRLDSRVTLVKRDTPTATLWHLADFSCKMLQNINVAAKTCTVPRNNVDIPGKILVERRTVRDILSDRYPQVCQLCMHKMMLREFGKRISPCDCYDIHEIRRILEQEETNMIVKIDPSKEKFFLVLSQDKAETFDDQSAAKKRAKEIASETGYKVKVFILKTIGVCEREDPPVRFRAIK